MKYSWKDRVLAVWCALLPKMVVLQLSFGSRNLVFLLKPWHRNEVKFEHVLCIYRERDFSVYF